MTTLGPEIGFFVPAAKILLSGAFAATLVHSMYESTELDGPFAKLVIGFLALCFYSQFAQGLSVISEEARKAVEALGGQSPDLKTTLLEAFKKSGQIGQAAYQNPTDINLPGLIEQAWRTGVWGVMSAVVQFVFLVSSTLLEGAHAVFWRLALTLFPLAAGVFPVFPRLMTNLALYLVELALWFPILALIERSTSLVARDFVQREGLGVYVVSSEILASLLILMIPAITHKLMSGAFAGDFGSQDGSIRWAKLAMGKVTNWRRG